MLRLNSSSTAFRSRTSELKPIDRLLAASAFLKGLLPERMEFACKRWYFRRQISKGRFRSPEPEFRSLEDYVATGDWVLDIGANVGHYSLLLSRLVGPSGRVIAIEPIPQTFELLVSNCALSAHKNTTCLNVAASDETAIILMAIPKWKGSNRSNLYEAKITPDVDDKHALSVLSVPVDAFELPNEISLIKIDVEGHEEQVVRGMTGLLLKYKPLLIVEGRRADSQLLNIGYSSSHLPGSPNHIWRHSDHAARSSSH
jgi:FkbM family methyltransferase